jgi:transcriptional regulator with XRE-family HTH domain
MAQTYFEELFSDKDNEQIYQQERLIVELTEAIYELMQYKKVKKKDLAEKLNVSQSQITQLLNGSANMQLRTISDILFTLGSKLKIKIEPLHENIRINYTPPCNCWNESKITTLSEENTSTVQKIKVA